MHADPVPSWGIIASPIGILLLIAFVIILYGLTQPRYRTRAAVVLGTGLFFLVGAGTLLVGVRSVHMAEPATIAIPTEFLGGPTGEREVRVRRASSRQIAAAPVQTSRPEAIADVDVANRIELFEGDRRTGKKIDALPEWVTAPVESHEDLATLESGSQATFDDCQAPLLEAARDRLAARLTTLHPETAGWRPDWDTVRNSRALLRRVRETQLVRIDVADSVIREPLCREYWQLSLQPEVIDRLLAVYRPTIARQRGSWLAGGVGVLTLLFGAMAVGLRATQRPRAAAA